MNQMRGQIAARILSYPGVRALGSVLLLTVASPGAGAFSLESLTSAAESSGRNAPLLSAVARVGAGGPDVPMAAARRVANARLPLAFEPVSEGAPAGAGYVAQGQGYTVFVGPEGALLALPTGTGNSGDPAVSVPSGRFERRRASASALELVGVRLEGASSAATAEAQAPLSGRIHRLKGNDPRQWQIGIQPHARVVYRGVYPGIDVAYYGNNRELEYDLHVAPGVSVASARLRFDGVRRVRLSEDGGLELETGKGKLLQRRPVAYQVRPGGKDAVEVAYRLNEDGSVGFEVGTHDAARPLVIDPVLSYSTLVGGLGLDQCWDIAVDSQGSAYVAGETESPNFSAIRVASTNSFRTNFQGGLTGVAGDAFVGKLNHDGTSFEWLTFLGGVDLDVAFAIGLAAGGEPVVAGFTTSTNFPITTGALQSTIDGLTNRFTTRLPLEAFVTRLKADGSGLVASTFFGGSGEDQVIDLVVADSGSVAAVGSTTSTNLVFPASSGQSTNGGSTDGFLAVFDANLGALVSGTYLGGSSFDTLEGVALGDGGVVHAVGLTFSTNLTVMGGGSPTNSGGADILRAGVRGADGSFVYAQYFGGNSDDLGLRLTRGQDGAFWVVGQTISTNLPVIHPLQSTNAGGIDALLARLSADGMSVEFSSYYGGASTDILWDGRSDAAGRLHFVGESLSIVLPGISTNVSLYATNSGFIDLVIGRLAPDLSVEATFIGGGGDDVAYAVDLDPAGNAYIAGRVRSVGTFPISSTNVAQTVYGGGRSDGCVIKVAYEPSLTAALAGDGVVVSWPAPNPGFVLETAPVRSAEPAQWTAVEGSVSLAGRRHEVRLPLAATNCLFRLRWAD
ncbi:MAG: hypothetical protein JNK85_21100 [Verrucomicrobiales bacterium]|nr:hypothetical protein [Verrucomicrobiales bacterium]